MAILLPQRAETAASAEDLAAAIRQMAADKAFRERMVENGAAFAEDGLDQHGGEVFGLDDRHQRAIEVGERVGGHAVRVRKRQAIDLGRERAEAGLVRHGLARERHSQQRAPGKTVLEADDGRALLLAGRFVRHPEVLAKRAAVPAAMAWAKELEAAKDYKGAVDRSRDSRTITFPTNRVIPVGETIGPGSRVHTYSQVTAYLERYPNGLFASAVKARIDDLALPVDDWSELRRWMLLASGDILIGGQGDDWIYGGEGDDELYGDSYSWDVGLNDGADILYGGDGADDLNGGLGDDILIGGSNVETARAQVRVQVRV